MTVSAGASIAENFSECAADPCPGAALDCSCAETLCKDVRPVTSCSSASDATGALACVGGGKCAAPDTPIATPNGEVAIASLRRGDLVYSLGPDGVVVAPVLRTSRTRVEHHSVVRITLDTGAVLEISGPHPLPDGRSIADIASGDRLDEIEIRSVERVAYQHQYTYDILVGSASGVYFAGGLALGSTLAPTH